jgi:hypothetical protein
MRIFPAVKREEYYADLELPLSGDEFIATQQKEMKAALTMLDKGMPKNPKVAITKKNGKPWIKVTPLEPQPEPKNLAALKADVGKHWQQIYLLDMLKEADLRIGFTRLFKSPASDEALPRETLQIRLLLCLYALGRTPASNASPPVRRRKVSATFGISSAGLSIRIASGLPSPISPMPCCGNGMSPSGERRPHWPPIPQSSAPGTKIS